MSNPLKDVLNIKKNELPLALLMFGYFFLVITSFWILKPLKKTLFITFYKTEGFDLFGWQLAGSQAELLAKILNMVVAFLAVVVFTWLARKYRRQQLTFIFSIFFILAYIVYSFIINTPGHFTVWSFYLFGDLFSTLMVATFFSFLNDSVTPDSAKRLYGLIGLGGVTGGVFGTSVVRVWIKSIEMSTWLWICFGIAIVIIAIAYTAGKLVQGYEIKVKEEIPEPATEKKSNPAFEGAKLVFKSRYLIAIVGIVGLYEIVSTIMDFQFTATIEHFVPKDAIGTHFSTIFAITNVVSLVVQLFLTSFIMTRFGLTVALSILPIMILLGSAGFLIVPVLWVGSFLNTADNGFSYSINQSAKETLYVPTSKDEKYKAKAFIDMFVQRFAKAIAVVISLGITTIFKDYSSIRWLSLFTLVIVFIWLIAVRYAGNKFKEFTESEMK